MTTLPTPSRRRVDAAVALEHAGGAAGAAAHRATLWPHRHGCDGFFVAMAALGVRIRVSR